MQGLPLRPRSLRAIAIISAALIGLTAISLVYVRPRLASLWPASAVIPLDAQVCGAAFADARRGVVLVCTSNPLQEAAIVTQDGGTSWKEVATGLVGGGHVRWFDADHAVLAGYTSTRAGVWITDDGGRSWASRTSPAGPTPAYTSEPPDFVDQEHGVNPSYLDQAAPPGLRGPPSIVLWRTDDGASTWRLAESRGLPRQGVKQLLRFVSPTVGFMAWWPPGDAGWPQLLTTADAGETWSRVSMGAATPAPTVGAGIAALGSRLVLWTLTLNGGPSGRAQLSTRVSDDGGQTWSDASVGPYGQGPPLEEGGNGALLLQDGNQLWVSANGRDWKARQLRPPAGVRSLRIISGVEVALFATGQRLSGGTVGVLLRSDDGGSRWRPIPLPKLPVAASQKTYP